MDEVVKAITSCATQEGLSDVRAEDDRASKDWLADHTLLLLFALFLLGLLGERRH